MNFLKKIFNSNKEYLKNTYICCFDIGADEYCIYNADGELLRTFETESALDVWIDLRRKNKDKCVIAKLVYPTFSSKEISDKS